MLGDLGSRLQGVLRKHDVLARYGGTEFLVLAVHCPEAGAEPLAERLREAVVREPVVCRNRTFHLEARVGVSTTSGGTMGVPEDLLMRAENALAEKGR